MKLLTDQTAARLHDLLGDPGPSRHLPRRFGWRSPVFPFGPLWLFGISFDGADVTVAAGAIRRGPAIYTSAQETVTITADNQWIGWKFDPADNTLIVIPDPCDDRPVDADFEGFAAGPLYKIGYDEDAERAWLTQVWQCGIIQPGLFAQEA
jgi:hypothetical protein